MRAFEYRPSVLTAQLIDARARIRKLEAAITILADHLVREGGFSKPIGEALKEALR